MKLKYAVLPAAVAMLFSAVSMADTNGKIYFRGTIKAPTCEINGNQNNLTVNLGDFEVKQFPATGTQIASPQPIKLELKNCTGHWANLTMEATDRFNNMIEITNTSGSAKGVGIIIKGENTMDAPRLPLDGVKKHWKELDSANDYSATYEFFPFVYQDASMVEAGTISAQLSYTIKYQ